MKTVQLLFSNDGQRKVEIFQRDDGTFGFTDWRYGRDEGAWYPCGRYSECIAPSAEVARKEAKGRVDWLKREATSTDDV